MWQENYASLQILECNTYMPRCGRGLVKAMNSERRVYFNGSGGIVV